MGTAALIVTADPEIADDLLRLAAAADAPAEVARDHVRARAAWRHPPLVLVGADLAAELICDPAPRRPGVVLVTTRPDDEEVYRTAVRLGAQDVAVLPDTEAWLVDTLAAAAEPAGERAAAVCVTGARGGAGASTLAAVLGLAAMQGGLRTLLVDGDPLGGGLDLLLGLEDAPGARWPDFVDLRGRLSSAALREALPGLGRVRRPAPGGELAVLSWHRGQVEDIPPEAMRTVLDAGGRGFDLVIVDLPRHLGAAGAEALLAAGLALVVVPAELRAVVAGSRVAAGVGRHTGDVRAVVRGPAPGGLTPDGIGRALGLPLAGAVPWDRRLAGALEHGELLRAFDRGPLADLCAGLVDALVSGRVRGGGRP
ncbi:MAG: hypothetical protein JWO67_6967 [Streptosporangiaceae bacterium]|nr:hypothetical protein [Streptosporangiaceae bacterium]